MACVLAIEAFVRPVPVAASMVNLPPSTVMALLALPRAPLSLNTTSPLVMVIAPVKVLAEFER